MAPAGRTRIVREHDCSRRQREPDDAGRISQRVGNACGCYRQWLRDRVGEAGGNWSYEKFTGKVGVSDLSGSLHFKGRKPRPLLEGVVESKFLNFKDLAPIVGADSNASKAQRDAKIRQPENKVLPVETFKTERLASIDADVQFTGRKIVREK